MERGAALAQVVAGIVQSRGLDRSPTALAARAASGEAITLAFGEPEPDGPVTETTVMYAASIAKQVIGLLLSQQVTAGVLDPERPLSSYVEDLPGWAGQVRVRHLVHHTSGLPPTGHLDPGADNDAVLAFLRRSEGPVTQPGARYAYRNVGYLCLAEILTRVSGQPVEQLAQASLFKPLGMQSTTLTRFGVTRAGHAPRPTTVGDGGLWTSAEDLLRWNDAMNTAAFGGEVHERAETPGTLDNGTPLDYAWGVRVIDHHGRRTLSHGGSWPTWSAKTIRQPDQGTSIGILTASEDAQAVTSAALSAVTSLAD